MFWSVKSTVKCQGWQFQAYYESKNKKLMTYLADFDQCVCVGGAGGRGEVSESINKRTFMKKIVSDSVNCISKKLWKIASADVKQ